MSVQVVDASSLAALLFGEPEAARVANLLEGAERIAPSLVRYEMASVCLKKQHAYPDLRDPLLSALDLYPQLGIVEAEVPATELTRLASDARVTAYDAAYLWVALLVRAPLLTLDRKLARAATRLGIPLVT